MTTASTTITPSPTAAPSSSRQRGGWRTILRQALRLPRGRVGGTILGVVLAIAVIGPFVTPHSPTANIVQPFAGPSSTAPLGGDVLGRDVLSRLLAGGWVLLLMAAAATAIGVVIGTASGIAAAYLRGFWDGTIMRIVDVVLAFPQLVFALLLISMIGPKPWLIVLAVGLTHAPQTARVIRSAALDISERDFVKAVEALGTKRRTVMVREILPNLTSPLMVEVGLRITFSIVVIAGLSFLGFGQAPPAANWGVMINENRDGLVLNPWSVIVPAVIIALLTIATNTLTDAIARTAIGLERNNDTAAPTEVSSAGKEA